MVGHLAPLDIYREHQCPRGRRRDEAEGPRSGIVVQATRRMGIRRELLLVGGIGTDVTWDVSLRFTLTTQTAPEAETRFTVNSRSGATAHTTPGQPSSTPPSTP